MYTLANPEPLTGLLMGGSFFVMVVGSVLIVMVGTYYSVKLIVDGVRKSQAAKLEAQARENQDRLKSLMIQRGMSADEIERVLNAEGSKLDFTSETRDAEARIVEVLSGNGYDGAAIERVLLAARVGGAIPPSVGRLVTTMAENWAKAADIERVLKTREKPATA